MKEIKKLLEEGKLIIGKDKTLKGLRDSSLSKVFLAANCPADLKEDVEHFASLSGAEVEQLDITNEELGDVCKKTFFIAVMGVKK